MSLPSRRRLARGATVGLGAAAVAFASAVVPLSAATAAEPGDQVLEQDGATVYLDENAATMLDDKVLDAAVDETGGVQFSIGLQQG